MNVVAQRTVGELRIDADGEGFVVRGPGEPCEIDIGPDPDEVREWLRFDDRGRFRPLAGAKTLRTGWRVRCRDEAQLAAVIDAIYPLALRHQRLWAEGRLAIVPLDTVLGRQSGRYEVAARLSERGRAIASDMLCGRCVKAPLWRGAGPAAGGIPCPEPCSVLVALCREAALWEAVLPASAESDPSIGFAQFEEPGNEIREAVIAALRGAKDG